MELRQRKRINNLPKFNPGKSGSLDALDAKANPYYQSGIARDVAQMVDINAPYKSIIAGPHTKQSTIATGGATGNIGAGTVTSAINGTLGVIGGFNQQQAAVKDQAGLFGMSGQRTDQAFGVNYQAQNDIDKSQAMADISASNTTNTLAMTGSGAAAGAAVGTAIVPGVGSLIGGAAGALTGIVTGLFGGKKAREKQRKKIQNAQQNANLINQVNRSAAASEGLQQQYYMDNGTTYDDLLYANRGKDLKRPKYDKGK